MDDEIIYRISLRLIFVPPALAHHHQQSMSHCLASRIRFRNRPKHFRRTMQDYQNTHTFLHRSLSKVPSIFFYYNITIDNFAMTSDTITRIKATHQPTNHLKTKQLIREFDYTVMLTICNANRSIATGKTKADAV